MDFHQLLARMQELDKPSTEAVAPNDTAQTEECGMPMNSAMPPMGDKADTPPPSLSVNMNAQGLEDIAELMKLLMKVNPDMTPKEPMPMPSLGPEPSIAAIKPAMPPLKMLPDMDNDPSHMEPDGDEGPVVKGLDRDGDGDHDMKDHDMEPKDSDKDDEKKEWANDPDPEFKDTDYMVNKLSGGLGRQQNMHPHNYKGGDNPLAMTKENLQASIKAELAQRLEEAKASYSAKAARAGKDIGKPGKQFAKIAKSAGERYGSKERGEKVAGAVLAKLRKK